LEREAANQAAQGPSGSAVQYSDAEQFRSKEHGIVSGAFNRSTGQFEYRNTAGDRVNPSPDDLRPMNSAGRQALQKQSVSDYSEFNRRLDKVAVAYNRNLDTIRTVQQNPGAFGSTPADFLGRFMTQFMGTDYMGLDPEERSRLDARFKQSQLETVSEFLAGTGPITEAEQEVAKGFSGNFKMEPKSIIQLFELQNFLHERDMKMRQDFLAQAVDPEDFSQWRLQWINENEDIEGLRALLDPSRYSSLLDTGVSRTPDDDGFLQAKGLRYRVIDRK